MPGLCLTLEQAQRLWSVEKRTCEALLKSMIDARFLQRTKRGLFVLRGDSRSARPMHTRRGAMKPSLILHPVSYSTSGKSALAKGLELARWYQAELRVIVLRRKRGASQYSVVRAFGDGGVEPHLAQFIESVGSIGAARISVVELAGDAVMAVVDYAKQTSADLVVVAANARSHGPYWRSGAYANDLSRRLSSPVLSVPAARDGNGALGARPFANILGVTDVSHALSTVSELATDLAQQVGAKLAFARASESIINTASSNGSDLVVIGRRDPGATNHVIMNSATAQVLRNAPCPVLVVPVPHEQAALMPFEPTAFATDPAFAHA
jgi:nucleotide-binding universal stress UspA family protein